MIGLYFGIDTSGYLKIGQGNLSRRTSKLYLVKSEIYNSRIISIMAEGILRYKMSQYFSWIPLDRFILTNGEDDLELIESIFLETLNIVDEIVGK